MRKSGGINVINVTSLLMAIIKFKVTRGGDIKVKMTLRLSLLFARSVMIKLNTNIVQGRGAINTMASNQKINIKRGNINAMRMTAM